MKQLLFPMRRHRRLLLPPGWVALGWLLLLGCGLLRAHWQQLRQENVMPLTMIPLRREDAKDWFGVQSKSPYGNPFDPLGVWNNLRPWHDAELQGHQLADFFNIAAVEADTRAIQADSSHAGGVRVRLLPGATYANLVALFNIMNYTDQKVYWLDIRHRPNTFYALTKKELPRDLKVPSVVTYGCCLMYQSPLPSSSQQWLAALQQPTWQLPLLLLTALGSLSAYRLALSTRSS